MFEEVGNFVIDSTGETMSVVRTKGGMSIMPLDEYKHIARQHKWNGKQNTKQNVKVA